MKSRLEKLFMVLASVWGVVRLILLRPRVIVFGNDMIGTGQYELRMAKLYQWLESQHMRYANLIHATPGAQVVKHWFQRRRAVIYLEGLEQVTRNPTALLSWLFRMSGVKQLWALDDYRHWPKVVATARRAGIYSVLFQHGRFTRHQSYLALPDIPSEKVPLPDRYIVWNEYWQEKLLKFSPFFTAHPGIVIVGGKPSAEQASLRYPTSVTTGSLHIVVVHEPVARPAEVRQLLDSLTALEDVLVSYKIRKDQSVARQSVAIGLDSYRDKGLTTVFEIPIQAQLILGSYSTLLYEAVAWGLPVGVVRMNSTQAGDLVEDGLAVFIDPTATDLRQQLMDATQVTPEELSRRAARLAVTVDFQQTLDTLIHA